jgi:hypothetical protein
MPSEAANAVGHAAPRPDPSSAGGGHRFEAAADTSLDPTLRSIIRLRGEGSNLQHLAPKASVLPIELPRNDPHGTHMATM